MSDPDGSDTPLAYYSGRVVLIVNVASKCGFTPQYEGLESLYRVDNACGLDVLGFPCNQFGDQEPGSAAEIAEFCSTEYRVTLPIFAKVDVNGPNADPHYVYLHGQDAGDFGPGSGPLYDHLAASKPETIGADEIKWSFTKFLVGRDGNVIRRYESAVTPEQIQTDIGPLLDNPS